MNKFRTLLSATFLSTAILFVSAAQAMTIPQFDRMAAQDRQNYMKFLVESAQKVLTNQGHNNSAAKVYRLFHEIPPGAHLSLGEAEFEGNLDNARIRDAQKAIQNPDAPRVQVESALALTLKKNGVDVTPEFLKDFVQVAGTFQPKLPPRTP